MHGSRRRSSSNCSNQRPTADNKEDSKKTESCQQPNTEEKKRQNARIFRRSHFRDAGSRSRRSSSSCSNQRPTADNKEDSKKTESCQDTTEEKKRKNARIVRRSHSRDAESRSRRSSSNCSNQRPTANIKEDSKKTESCQQPNTEEKKRQNARIVHRSHSCDAGSRRRRSSSNCSNQRPTADIKVDSKKTESCQQPNTEEKKRQNARIVRRSHSPDAGSRRRRSSSNCSNQRLTADIKEDSKQTESCQQPNTEEKKRQNARIVRRSHSRDAGSRRCRSSSNCSNQRPTADIKEDSKKTESCQQPNTEEKKRQNARIVRRSHSRDSGSRIHRNPGARTRSSVAQCQAPQNAVMVRFIGIQLPCVASSHDQIIQLLNDNNVKFTGSNILQNQDDKNLLDFNVQLSSKDEAESCKQLIGRHFKIHESPIKEIRGMESDQSEVKHSSRRLHKAKRKFSFEEEKSLEIINLPPRTLEGELVQLVTNSDICEEKLYNIKITSGSALLAYSSRKSAIIALRNLYGLSYKGTILDINLLKRDHDLEDVIFQDLKHNLQKEVEDSVSKIMPNWDLEIQDLTDAVEMINNSRKHKFIPIEEAESIDAKRKDLTFKINQLINFKLQLKCFIEQLEFKIEQVDQMKALGQIRNELFREIKKAEHPLPIYAFRSEIVNTVFGEETNACVIIGETGSGKSTQIAQYLADADVLLQHDNKHRIACTQPRKVAAISLAKRVAEEYGCEVGEQIGYMVGSYQKTSSNTIVTFMTDRVLLNSLLQDPNLERFSCVVIDEAHERSIDTDILIALLKKVSYRRPELKIIITSATIDEQVFCRYFNDCPFMKIPGRAFPVTTTFASDFQFKANYVKEAVEMAQFLHETKEPGDILVFLTSANEIERACCDLAKRLGIENDNGNAQVLPLHGKLQPQDQMAIFNPPLPGKRKIVFATNIAETSVTIDGIKYVIDTGMVKERKYDPRRNMSVLEVTTISRASAEQRKGRAGRTSTGECFRLYSENDYDEMEENNKPEILRVHLGMAVLQLLQLGIEDVGHFEFVQPPQEGALEEALNMLEFLGAVSESNNCHQLTDIGKQMSLLTIEPRLSKLVLTSIKQNMAEEGILVAGLLSAGGNVFYRSGSDVEKRKSDESKLDFSNVHGDVFTMLDVYDEWKKQPEKSRGKWCFKRSINGKTMKVVSDNIKDIKTSLKSSDLYSSKSDNTISWNDKNACENLRKIILSVYAQNLCVYNGHPRAGYTIVFQMKTAVLHPSSSLKSLDEFPKWIVYTEFSRTTQDFILNLTSVEYDWVIEVAPHLAKCIDLESIRDNQVHEELVPCVGPTLMGRIIGKAGQGLRKIEEQVCSIMKDESSALKTFCVIECRNKTGSINLFVPKNVAIKASELVKKAVNTERGSLEKQQLEVAIGHSSSGVRQVIGKGADPKFILMPEDFRTLEITGVTDVCSQQLYAWLEQFKVHIHDIFEFPAHSKQAKRGIWGKVTFTSPFIAEVVLKSFPEDDAMSCKAACQGTLGRCNLGQELVATWKTGSSKGHAFVTCDSIEDALILQRVIHGKIIKDSIVYCRLNKKVATSLYLSQLGPNISEEDIERTIHHNSGISIPRNRITVPRNPPVTEKADIQFREELKDLLVNFTDKAKIDVRIPKRKFRSTDNMNTSTQRSRQMTAFITLNGVATEIINRVITEGPLFSNKIGHQLEIKRLVKSRLFCPGYVYKIVKDELIELKQASEKMFKEARIQIDDRFEKETGVFLNLEFKNPDNLVKIQAEFVKAINGNEVQITANSRVLKEISSNYWRQFLDKSTQATKTRAFYDKRDKVVRVYGTGENLQNMIMSINDFITKAESNFCEINLGDFTKAKGRALQKLRKVFGATLMDLKVKGCAESVSYIFKSRIIVVYGESSSQSKIRDLIKDCLQREGIKCDQEDVIDEDECGVCFTPVEADSHRLEGCGHNYCKECLVNLLHHSVESKEFPISCPRENCSQVLFMCDINLLTRGNQAKEKLYAATLDTFIAQKSNGEYKYCITPNCTMVYRVSKDGRLFLCTVCNQQFCTSCRLDHPGMTCGEYKANKETSDSVLDWAKRNRKDVKTCKCGAIIEKTGGCRKMHCTRCHKSMCWMCSEVFDTEDTCYQHLRSVHGGIMD